MWIETRILFSFGPLVVERALWARWKTRDGGISRAKPLVISFRRETLQVERALLRTLVERATERAFQCA